MAASLAVVWQDGELEPPAVGRLEVLPDRLHLEGARRGQAISEDVPLAEIKRSHVGRADRERIGGRQTLVLECLDRHGALLISSIFGIGTLVELVERLGA